MAHSSQQSPAGMDAAGIVGVLGGMGPLATVDFMRKMLQATPAVVDQEHVPVVVSSIPQVPDRTQAFRREGASPLAAMVASGRRLVAAGAGLAVVPCNAAHLWFDEIQQALGLPMLHLVDAALEDAVIEAGPGGRIGLLATDATLASGLYVNRALPPGAGQGLQWVLPTAGEMLTLLMPGVAAIKAGPVAGGRRPADGGRAGVEAPWRRGGGAGLHRDPAGPGCGQCTPSGGGRLRSAGAPRRGLVAGAAALRDVGTRHRGTGATRQAGAQPP